MVVRRRYGISVVVVLQAIGCAEEIKLAADKRGDLSYVLDARDRPDVAQRDSCGVGKLTETGTRTLRRAPYLQQVTTSSALVLFTATDGQAVTVDVTLPDGRPVGSFPATKDEAASVGRGLWQGVVRIAGLEPNSIYCYALQGMTERAGFRTAPSATAFETTRFLAFGDSGDGGTYQYAVARQMFTVPFDLVLHLGDVAYDDGTLAQLERGYFRPYSELGRSFPAFLIAGNHEYGTQSAAPFRQAFALPENGQLLGLERWYSFDWGRVHFVGLDTERIGPEQAAWLEQDLALAQAPWKIVFAHRPPFSSGEHGSNEAFQRYFVPVIARHRVALVLSGHEHHYERTKPLAGTTYIVSGGGGHDTRSVGSSPFTAFSVETLHFVQVEVKETELFVHAIDGIGTEFDSARISRPD
jgi:acid phosphatase type 7